MSREFTVPFYGWVNERWIWAVLSVFLVLCVTWAVLDIKSSGKFPNVFCVAGSSGCAAWFGRGHWNTCWQQLKGTVFTGHPSWSHPRKHQLLMLLKPLEHFWNRGALAAVPNWYLSEAQRNVTLSKVPWIWCRNLPGRVNSNKAMAATSPFSNCSWFLGQGTPKWCSWLIEYVLVLFCCSEPRSLWRELELIVAPLD